LNAHKKGAKVSPSAIQTQGFGKMAKIQNIANEFGKNEDKQRMVVSCPKKRKGVKSERKGGLLYVSKAPPLLKVSKKLRKN